MTPRDYSQRESRPLFDACASRHGGNEQSRAAFERVDVAGDEARCLQAVRDAGANGITCREVAATWNDGAPVGLNVISGRFTSLLAKGLIHRAAVEPRTRDGCSVYFDAELIRRGMVA